MPGRKLPPGWKEDTRYDGPEYWGIPDKFKHLFPKDGTPGTFIEVELETTGSDESNAESEDVTLYLPEIRDDESDIVANCPEGRVGAGNREHNRFGDSRGRRRETIGGLSVLEEDEKNAVSRLRSRAAGTDDVPAKKMRPFESAASSEEEEFDDTKASITGREPSRDQAQSKELLYAWSDHKASAKTRGSGSAAGQQRAGTGGEGQAVVGLGGGGEKPVVCIGSGDDSSTAEGRRGIRDDIESDSESGHGERDSESDAGNSADDDSDSSEGTRIRKKTNEKKKSTNASSLRTGATGAAERRQNPKDRRPQGRDVAGPSTKEASSLHAGGNPAFVSGATYGKTKESMGQKQKQHRPGTLVREKGRKPSASSPPTSSSKARRGSGGTRKQGRSRTGVLAAAGDGGWITTSSSATTGSGSKALKGLQSAVRKKKESRLVQPKLNFASAHNVTERDRAYSSDDSVEEIIP